MASKAGGKGSKGRRKVFSAVAAVKQKARDLLGRPPGEKVIPERNDPGRREKHKPSLGELLNAERDGRDG